MRAGSEGLSRLAIASGSMRLALPSNRIDEVSVDLPDPFGPAITANVGMLLHGRGEFTQDLDMRFAPRSRPEPDLLFRSVGEFPDVTAGVVHKDHGVTGGKGYFASLEARGGSSLCELVGEDLNGLHKSIISHLRELHGVQLERRGILALVLSGHASVSIFGGPLDRVDYPVADRPLAVGEL